MASRRQERVNARLVEEVSGILRGLKDGRLGFITIIRSEVSPDMRHANIFVSIFGDDEEVDRNMAALQSATGLVRKQLGRVIQMKNTPEIQFRLEHGVRVADEMNYLIATARATDPNPSPATEGSSPDSINNEDEAN